MLSLIFRIYSFFFRHLARLFLKAQGATIPATVVLEGIVDFKQGTPHGKLSIEAQSQLGSGLVIHLYGGTLEIGTNTFIGPKCCFFAHGGIKIGSNSLIAMNTTIVSSNHTIPSKSELIRYQPDVLLPVSIGDDVWIGANCSILGGVTIGNGVVVGAGSVVTKDLPDYSVAVGSPARILRFRE